MTSMEVESIANHIKSSLSIFTSNDSQQANTCNFDNDSFTDSPSVTPAFTLSPSYVRTGHFFPVQAQANDFSDTLSTLSDLSYTSGTGSYAGELDGPFFNGSELFISALDHLGTKQKKLSRKLDRRKRKLRSKKTGKEIPIEFKEEYDFKIDTSYTFPTSKRISKSPSASSPTHPRKKSKKESDASIYRFSIMSENSPGSPTRNSNQIDFGQTSTKKIKSKKSVVVPRRKSISTKKLLKLLPHLEHETIEGSSTAIYVGPDMTTKRYHITREQLLLILQKKEEQRLLRWERAKQYANRLNRFSARYGCNGEINGKTVVSYTSEKIRSTLLTWIMKHRFQKIRKATLQIQRWYRRVKVLQSEAEKRRLIEEAQQIREMETLKQLKYKVLVQRHFRTYVEMIKVKELLEEKCSLLLQRQLRMFPFRDEIKQKLFSVRIVQSILRKELSQVNIDERIRNRVVELKRKIVEEYHRTLAPYPKRAVFFFGMKESGRAEFLECVKMIKTLKSVSRFTAEKDLYSHQEEIYEKLKTHETDISLISILNKIFKPQLTKHGRGLVSIIKKDGSEVLLDELDDPNDFERLLVPTPPELHYVTKISQIPFHFVLKELVKMMFHKNLPMDKINWSSVIIIHYYLSDGVA